MYLRTLLRIGLLRAIFSCTNKSRRKLIFAHRPKIRFRGVLRGKYAPLANFTKKAKTKSCLESEEASFHEFLCMTCSRSKKCMKLHVKSGFILAYNIFLNESRICFLILIFKSVYYVCESIVYIHNTHDSTFYMRYSSCYNHDATFMLQVATFTLQVATFML